MAVSLFLNKIKVDITPKPVTRKIQIGDVGDIDARKSSFSYTIKLPRTSRNVQVLEMLGVIGNESRKPYETIACDYVVDGIYLVENGFAIIKSTSGTFDLNIIDGVKGLAELLKGKKIKDLPLDDLNHVLTTQEYIDSYSNTEGFIYGIADYGRGVSSSLKVEKQAPSIFTHTLFRRIFESNGLTLQGEFFTTNDKYLNEVVTPSRGYEVTTSDLTTTAKGGADTDTLSDYQTSKEWIEFEEKFTFTDSGLVGASIVSDDIVFSIAGTYKLDLDIFYSLYVTYAYMRLKINGSSKAYFYLPEGNSQNIQKSVTFSVEAGDVVQLWISGSSELEAYEPPFVFEINYSARADTSLFLQEGGQLIKASDYIGEIDQLAFIKDVINRYGLVLHPVSGAANYRFKRLEALLNDREAAEDWTEKVSKKNSESYKSGYAQINKANYIYPEATVVATHDGEMLIDNENAETEKTIFSSPFEIPVNSSAISGNETFKIPVWTEEDLIVENAETPLKIMSLKRIDTTITARLFEEVTGITESENIPFLSLDFISLQYFISNFYKAFQSMIENYKDVQFEMNLSVIDVFNLDFFKLKYLKQTGRFYYLNTVQHRTGRLSKVNMIEISDFPANQPPSQVGSYSFSLNHSATRTITLANLLTDYEDPELDAAKKIKIISGFNTDILIKQDGVTITAETEINVEDLALTVTETIGGLAAYSKSWIFAIADVGSGTYGTETGTLAANVEEVINQPPVANAGSNQSVELPPEEAGFEGEELYIYLNGSASYDFTGDIVYYLWELQSKPAVSSAYVDTQNTATPTAYLILPVEVESVGTYTMKLTVTDEYGLTDTDTMTVTVTIAQLQV